MDKRTDEFFASVFKPGSVILSSGFKGGGKSHTAVAVGEQLVKGKYPSVGKVVMLTNMFFLHKVHGEIIEETPPDVYHITTMKELFSLIVDIIERYGRDVVILMILDEAQNFIAGDSNQTNASAMMKEFLGTIRKFRLVVWFLTPSARSIGPAFRNFLNDPKYPGNLTCMFKKDLGFNQRYIKEHNLPFKPNELMLVKSFDSDVQLLQVPVTEWTGTSDNLKEGGYCYDHEATATFYVGDGFDWSLFNRTIGGVSSLNILKTIKAFYAEHCSSEQSGSAPKVSAEEAVKLSQIEIAVNLLNSGMTERDAAMKVGLSRDQLRYRLEKAGYIKIRRTNESESENCDSKKCWVKPSPDVHTKNETASSLGGCVSEGGNLPPIYISKSNPEKRALGGALRHKSDSSGRAPPKVLVDDQSKDEQNCESNPSRDAEYPYSTPLPEGRYTIEELRDAVKWCIGEDGT